MIDLLEKERKEFSRRLRSEVMMTRVKTQRAMKAKMAEALEKAAGSDRLKKHIHYLERSNVSLQKEVRLKMKEIK